VACPGPIPPKDSASTTGVALGTRALPLAVHVGGTNNQHFAAYEPTLTSRSAGYTRGVYNRYPLAPPPSPIYGYDSDLLRLVSIY